MQDVCGFSIERTTSLHDYLYLDRLRKGLKIFSYKCHVQTLIDSHDSSHAKQPPVVPLQILKETKLSLDLLFPFWDSRTVAILANEKQDFHEHGLFEAARTLTLSDFDYWTDHRNLQQFWTFWIAMVILVLTEVVTGTTIIQAWASVKALGKESALTMALYYYSTRTHTPAHGHTAPGVSEVRVVSSSNAAARLTALGALKTSPPVYDAQLAVNTSCLTTSIPVVPPSAPITSA